MGSGAPEWQSMAWVISLPQRATRTANVQFIAFELLTVDRARRCSPFVIVVKRCNILTKISFVVWRGLSRLSPLRGWHRLSTDLSSRSKIR